MTRVLRRPVGRVVAHRITNRERRRQDHRILGRNLVEPGIVVQANDPLRGFHLIARREAIAGRRPLDGEVDQRIVDRPAVRVVGRLDHERGAFPSASRIAEPLLDAGIQVRAAIDRDDPCLVDHLGDEDHVTRRLLDVESAVVSVRHHHRRHAARDAAIPAVEVIDRFEGDVFPRQSPVTAHREPAALAFGGQRRQQTVRRVDQQIGLPLRNAI
jgi:hypothetical protein